MSNKDLTGKTLFPPFSWVGGKTKIAKLLVDKFPPHKVYAEVFCGGLSVLYAKPFVSTHKYTEVINDNDSNLINLYKVIKYHPQTLNDYLSSFLISREIFEDIKYGRLVPRNKFEKAVFYLYLINYSFSGKKTHYIKEKYQKPKLLVKEWAKFSQRLKRVSIECLDFKDFIKSYDTPNTFFYLDPPYISSEDYYQNAYNNNNKVFDKNAHIELSNILRNIKGKFLLSYNNDEFIKELYKDFKIEYIDTRYTLASTTNLTYVQELLISNY